MAYGMKARGKRRGNRFGGKRGRRRRGRKGSQRRLGTYKMSRGGIRL